jgi:hypothetical protein
MSARSPMPEPPPPTPWYAEMGPDGHTALTREVERQLRPKPPLSNLDFLCRMIVGSVVLVWLMKACTGSM